MTDKNIHTLMKSFSALERAELGRGPKHPTLPYLDIATEVEMFLRTYPFLKKDKGYVDFLECYAGAWVAWPNNDLVIDLFGFTDVSTHIVVEDGPIVDDKGFLTFCDGMVRIHDGEIREGVIGQGFAFDATGKRKWGIYRYVSDSGIEEAIYWYCETFLEWLDAIIETKGKLPA